MNDARSSDPLDPLQGFTGLSLFHQSFKAIPDSSTSIPFDFDLNLQAIHSQFNSTASQVKLVDQVKNILSDTSKILKSGIPQAKQNSEVVPEKAEDNPLQRIPASGRELARFSVKPNSRNFMRGSNVESIKRTRRPSVMRGMITVTITGSLAEEVNNGSFDELLSLNTECLEVDDAVTHVQKCLRMKPIEPVNVSFINCR
ncbi:hypothetical protein C1H46_037636 [Malus baccata]|uniref:Uncharacterized protein n=1 Tax=Malus baccata TaxID=106549 RepID=A0A540KRJ2_MALBA|nr:hypothetical protein C1H46_037636 [Malus baccata]